MELFCEPPMYGRDEAGHSSTTATHQPAARIIDPNATRRCPRRRPIGLCAARRYTRARAGRTTNACSILVRNANPTRAPPSASHRTGCARSPAARRRVDSSARMVEATDPISSSTSSASGLLNLNIRTATGVRARTVPAIRPATGDRVVRRTVAYSRATEAKPISACGARMLQEDRPNKRTDSAIAQSDIGVLSTVIEFAASEDPKKKAFHDADPACAAAE